MPRTAAVSLAAAAALLAALIAAPAASADGPCPRVAPAPPPVAGVEGYVFIAQHCPDGVDPNDPARFTVTIDYGDGTTGPGLLHATTMIVGGQHRYAKPGTYAVTAVVRDQRTGAETRYPRELVIDAPYTQLERPPLRFTVDHLGFNQTLVAFESSRPYAAAELRATVTWGDGTRSRGTVRKSGRTYTVVGKHRYRSMRNRTIRITVTHKSGAKAVLTAQALVGRVFDAPRTQR